MLSAMAKLIAKQAKAEVAISELEAEINTYFKALGQRPQNLGRN